MRPTRIEPQPGQESVWDYPRPPRLDPTSEHVQVIFNDQILVDTHRAIRILETSHPPVYSFPPEDVRREFLSPSARRTFCEFKGQAQYWTVQIDGQIAKDAVWSYPDPTPEFESIRDYLSVYPSRMDRCVVNGEEVQAQAGDFYGGWITRKIVGPFKGGPGTWGW